MALTAKKVYAILKRQISDMEAKLNRPVRYRGTVATADLLPLNPDIGDMYNIESKSIYGEAGMNVAWNGVVWGTMGAPIDMSLYFTKEEANTTIQNMVNEYLEKNPVKPGATTEQAQQIKKNTDDVASLKEDIEKLKQGCGSGSVGSGSGVTTAQASSLWSILQKTAFAEQLTEEEINTFKTSWGITTENIPATGISLDKTTLSFTTSATQNLTATVEPLNSTDKVTWESSNTGIATVSGGVVTPIGNGSCTITAKAGSYSASCTVTVAVEGEIVIYTITNDLVNATSDNLVTSINEGSAYNATITANSGYTLEGATVSVTMGGTDITSTAFSNGAITIASVTGNIVITVSAVQSGGETTDALPTDGLLAYFDFRNTTPEINTQQGLTKFNANQGNGCLFTWSASAFTSSDDYGVKKMVRSLMFGKDGGTNQSELGTSFSMLFKGYDLANGCFVSNDYAKISNTNAFRSTPKYNTSSSQVQLVSDEVGYKQGTGYIDVYFVVDSSLFKLYINGELAKTYNGTDYEDFVSWYSKVTTTVFGEGNYQTALALYEKALSEVEIVEARAFLQTLEVA